MKTEGKNKINDNLKGRGTEREKEREKEREREREFETKMQKLNIQRILGIQFDILILTLKLFSEQFLVCVTVNGD